MRGQNPTIMRYTLLNAAGTLVCLAAIAGTTLFAQTAGVQGVVTDEISGEPLPAATILIVTPGTSSMVNSSAGAATDLEGRYAISGVPAGDFEILVSFVGYGQYRSGITLLEGRTITHDMALEEVGIDLNTITVSASRRAEKVLDAPASIDVLSAEEVSRQATQSPALALRNVTGFDLAQTGADRFEAVLRGFNNAFSGALYVMTDYRQANAPSLNANVYSVMPISNIDIDRIEVVRGPGSALYGAGVDQGVVHFITKDAFQYPGTTVSVYGGERALVGLNARHAGVINGKLGYKISGFYSRVDDWELDPNDPEDAVQLEADEMTRDYNMSKYNVNGTLEYRFNSNTLLTVTGGYSGLTGIVMSGIGTLYGDGFNYQYAQARLRSGPLFAQVYFNRNDAANSKVLGTGQDVIDYSTVLVAQTQYQLESPRGRQQLIFGADAKITTPDSRGSIYGRNEDHDKLQEIGGYVQSTTEVTPQLDLTLAGRIDYHNVFARADENLLEQVQFSPRAALVFKPDLNNSFRLTFNHAFTSPGTNSLFLDLPAATSNIAGPYNLVFQARGTAEGFTFNNYRETGAMAFSLPIPALFNQPVPIDDIPLGAIYGMAYDAPGGIRDMLLSDAPLPAPLDVISNIPSYRALFADLLGSFVEPLAASGAGTAGEFGGLPDKSFEKGYAPRSGPVDLDGLDQSTSQVLELGYKGIFNRKLLLATDFYYARAKNFVGPLLLETPLVYLTEDLVTDLSAGLIPLVEAAAADSDLLASFLTSLELTPADAAGIVAGLVGGGLVGVPAGIPQPDQKLLGDPLPEGADQAVGGMLAYRNFGNITYWGVDVSAQYMASEELDFFGSVSIVSDDLFTGEELGDEDASDLELALNAPTFKVKAGANLKLDNGLNVNISARYLGSNCRIGLRDSEDCQNDSGDTIAFPVRSGPYVGNVDEYVLMDVGLGYQLKGSMSGMRLDVLAQNILNNMHREFVGAPKLGRMTTVRLTYNL